MSDLIETISENLYRVMCQRGVFPAQDWSSCDPDRAALVRDLARTSLITVQLHLDDAFKTRVLDSPGVGEK